MGLFCCCFSGCSENYKGPLSFQLIEYDTYKKATDSIDIMNDYVDEGKYVSFDYQIEEFNNQETKYCVYGLNVTSHYFENDNSQNKKILKSRIFYIKYLNNFEIIFNAKHNDVDIIPENLEWKLLLEINKNDYRWNSEFVDSNNNVPMFAVETLDCNFFYTLVDNANYRYLTVGFKQNETETIYNNHKNALKTRILEALND